MRRTTDEECANGERGVGAILRRAANLQAAHDASSCDPGSGITLTELEKAAADVGIDPRFVRAAAEEQDRGAAAAGPAGIFELRRDVPVEVSDDAWEGLVAELRRTFGHPGATSRTGRSYEWQLKRDVDPESNASILVSVRPRNGHSEIEILSSIGSTTTVAWALSGVAGFMATLLTVVPLIKFQVLSPTLGLLLAAAIVSTILLATRSGIKSWVRKDRQKLHRLMDTLSKRAQEVEEVSPVVTAASVDESALQVLSRHS